MVLPGPTRCYMTKINDHGYSVNSSDFLRMRRLKTFMLLRLALRCEVLSVPIGGVLQGPCHT